MKNLLLIFGILTLNMLDAQSLPNYVPQDSLIGWWNLDGDVNDVSGNTLNGSSYNVTSGSGRFIGSISSLAFNGSNSYTEIPTDAKFDAIEEELTLSVWIKPSASTSYQTIIARRDFVGNPNGERHHFELSISPDGAINFSAYDNSQLNLTNVQYNSTDNVINWNSWNHLLVRFTSIELKVYHDLTVVVAQQLNNQILSPNNHWVNFGRVHRSSGTSFFNEFNGLIDDVGIWNRALNSSEIIQLYFSSENNISTGSYALNSNTTGVNNTAIGVNALSSNTTGSFNTALGTGSLSNLLTGGSNSTIGYNTQASSATATNQTIIGFEATGQADNSVVLGNDDVTAVYMAEDRGAKIYAGEGDFSGDIVTAGNITVSSDIRLKKDIVNLPSTIDNIKSLRPVSYSKKNSLNSEEYGSTEVGFIAQELQEVYPDMVSEDESEDSLLSVSYLELIPVLIKAIQEQQVMIERQQKQIESLENVITSKE